MKCDAAVAEKQILKFLHNRLWGYSYLVVALLFMKAGMARPQASFPEESAEGLTSRPVPACIPATNLSQGELQMTLCVHQR